MKIENIEENRRRFMDLLLIGDEQEDMVEKYIDRGDMFVLYDNELIGACIVIEEDRIFELKNIALYPEFHGQGYGKKLIEFLFEYYQNRGKTMYVGTGDSPWILQFYKSCGFEESHRIANFFIDNYDHPIVDCGKQLRDMIYLKREFRNR